MTDGATQSRPFGLFERALAWRYLRARREHGGASLISIISFVGIALAVTALIVTMSLMTGFRETLTNALIGGQGHVFVGVSDRTEDEALTLAEDILELPGIKSVAPILQGQVLASGPGRSSGALVRGVRPQDLYIYPGLSEQAEESGFGEGKNGGNVVFVGRSLARSLGVIVGDEVTLLGQQGTASPFGSLPRKKIYVVGGYVQTGSIELDQAYIFMPLKQAQLFFKETERFQTLDIRLEDYRRTELARERILAKFGPRFFITDWKQQNGAYLNALRNESGLMRIIFLILITITSLNIITGVVMLVKNKARDIAILRTIGASRGAMMRIFVIVGATLGTAGALTGLAAGLLLVINIDAVEAFLNVATGGPIFDPEIYGLEGLPAKLNLGEAVFTAGWAITMSILVTLLPAWAAAKTDPVEALRFE